MNRDQANRSDTQEPEGISESEAKTVEERSRLTPFSKVTVGANLGPSWHILGTGDFGGDGDADILWQNNNGQAAIWLMSGTTPIREPVFGSNPGPSWHIHAAS